MREAERFDDEDVWDIAAVVALFSLSNRLAHAHDIRPNREFHTMGRRLVHDPLQPHGQTPRKAKSSFGAGLPRP